mmetsp:Transcript_21127/g.42099  ORF Transcript_21127/g.42099 Transcript_21127/m.42099 type:complete len:319 (-) Transcript_21127:122-1078(-)|eukprot:CAMPEP_0182455204 /NCGR_PEP_ID=MMETSP1319-20130603/1477_1 /TAXON_ID=172717 /ORGANISM="Bolidomonas pacifica, Strain RCC208" /LENGTH=318 /DNA_ID=CAMNT_0024653243 /DNA_START=169 /DNA_END=1125 /DNA_ORIENTATION=-
MASNHPSVAPGPDSTATSPSTIQGSTDGNANGAGNGDLDDEFMDYLTRLSFHHRQEVLALRSARRHKLFALICFLFFIVARLWVLAILENDYGLMTFCAVCTVCTIHIWRKESRRGDAQITETIRELVRTLEGLEGGSGSEANSGVENDAKREWRRFKWKAEGGPPSSSTILQGGDGDIETGGAGGTLPLPPPAPPTPNFERKTPECQHDGGDGGHFAGGDASPNSQQNAGLQGQSLCSICLCDYDEDDCVVVLPCKHIFHDDCLNQWIDNHHKCPLCNLDLRSEQQVRQEELLRREEESRNASQRQMQQSGILVFTL